MIEMRDHGKEVMQYEAVRWLCAVSVGLVCGAVAACAGSETPRVSDDLEQAIADTFGNGSVGASGSNGVGGRGNAGSAGSANAGSAGSSAAGSGGAADECNGFDILQESCDGGSCHGAGAPNGNFAESVEIAAAFAGEAPVTAACAMDGPVIDTENARGSLLIQKVNGTVPCGSPMPLVGQLSDDEIDCLEEWIEGL